MPPYSHVRATLYHAIRVAVAAVMAGCRYRLATHLSFAFVTYGLLAWTAMDLLEKPGLKDELVGPRCSRAGHYSSVLAY